jgi:hypothetical protein
VANSPKAFLFPSANGALSGCAERGLLVKMGRGCGSRRSTPFLHLRLSFCSKLAPLRVLVPASPRLWSSPLGLRSLPPVLAPFWVLASSLTPGLGLWLGSLLGLIALLPPIEPPCFGVLFAGALPPRAFMPAPSGRLWFSPLLGSDAGIEAPNPPAFQLSRKARKSPTQLGEEEIGPLVSFTQRHHPSTTAAKEKIVGKFRKQDVRKALSGPPATGAAEESGNADAPGVQRPGAHSRGRTEKAAPRARCNRYEVGCIARWKTYFHVIG